MKKSVRITNDGSVHILPAGRVVTQPVSTVLPGSRESGSRNNDAPLIQYFLHSPIYFKKFIFEYLI